MGRDFGQPPQSVKWKGPGAPGPKVQPDDPLGVSPEDLDAIMRANEGKKREG